MSDIGDKIEELGNTMKAQFRLLATGNMDNAAQLERVQQLGQRGQVLQKELAEAFNVAAHGLPEETLAKILRQAQAQQLPGTETLKEALIQLIAIRSELPEDSCPTMDGMQEAARHALNL